MLYIRADANREIASGHVMRCISIAKAARKRGIQCSFITADREAEKLITENGFSLLCLESVWSDLDKELDQLLQMIDLEKIENLLVDSYYVTKEYLSKLSERTNVIYIDDMNRFQYPVDILINYGINYEKFEYEKTYANSKTKLLLGCYYTPLREEFASVEFNIKEVPTDILITTGGADTKNIAVNIIKYMLETQIFKEMHFHIISGSFNNHISDLKNLEARYENITVYENVNRMAELMTGCDIAISAGGTTLYELCACGIPSICLAFEDNQLETVKGFQDQELMLYAGDIRDGENECYSRIYRFIEIYKKDISLRQGNSANMQKLVNGKGAERIINSIMQDKI
jgi:UDP-2,4-diacetamido-2,4,6-trideoxy-beta-L-altropyranose hydrolase